MQELLTRVNQIQANDHSSEVAILAGHYCLAPDLADLSHEGEAEYLSFKLGVQLYQQLSNDNKPARLILWVNDIGINNELRAQIKTQFTIPDNYIEILNEYHISPTAVEVIFESTSRNKASVLLRKKIKNAPEKFDKYNSNDKGLVRCIDTDSCTIEQNKTVYAIPGPEGAPLVMKEGNNPKCNLILGTLFSRISLNKANLVFVNIFNDIYIERIRLGIFVAQKVYELPHKFINFFCDDEEYFEETYQ